MGNSAIANALEYLGKIWQLRYFWMSLIKLDLQTRYRHSFLGIGWSLIRPVAMSVVFCAIFCKIFKLPIQEYAPFILTGLTVWQFLVEATLSGCGSFTRGAPYIRQKSLPLAIFPLRTVLGSGFHAVISLALAIVIAWFFNGSFNPTAYLALIPSVVLIFFLALSMAILFGLFHVHFPDTQHLLEIVFQIIFYLTPVMYYPELLRERGGFTWLVDLNPFAHVLDLVRQPIWKGEPPALQAYVWGLGFISVIGLLALWCLKKMERTLVFWV